MGKTTTFLPVWKQRLQQDIDSLKHEIKKPKKERNKSTLKRLLKDCKELRDIIKELEGEQKKCPKCGEIVL